jgi:glutathione S-transferase
MTLRLIGHYDSPFVRRVGVSLHVLGIPFERQLLSVFSNAEEMRAFNPLVRVPALVLDDGECLIDSAAILDYLDETVGPDRALMPSRGKARRDALQSPSPTSVASLRPRSTRPGSPVAAASRRERWPSSRGGLQPPSRTARA